MTFINVYIEKQSNDHIVTRAIIEWKVFWFVQSHAGVQSHPGLRYRQSNPIHNTGCVNKNYLCKTFQQKPWNRPHFEDYYINMVPGTGLHLIIRLTETLDFMSLIMSHIKPLMQISKKQKIFDPVNDFRTFLLKFQVKTNQDVASSSRECHKKHHPWNCSRMCKQRAGCLGNLGGFHGMHNVSVVIFTQNITHVLGHQAFH